MNLSLDFWLNSRILELKGINFFVDVWQFSRNLDQQGMNLLWIFSYFH